MTVDWQLFRFPFGDERWKNKAVIGGLLALFGVIFLPLYLPLVGYAVRIMRQTIEGESPSLPEWDDWGELIADGLRFAAVWLLYTLPAGLFMCCAYTFWFLSFPVIGSRGSGLPPAAFAGTTIAMLGLFAVGMLLTYPLVFLAFVAESRMVARGSLKTAFEFESVWRLARVGFGNYFLASVVLYGFIMLANAAIVMAVYTVVFACLFPVLLAGLAFYCIVLMGALYGMAYRETRAQLAVSGAAA